MRDNRAIIIGWINKSKPADCGETMKNQLMIKRLEELGVKCYQADFKGWKKRPWVFLQLLWYLLIHSNSTIIFSTSTINAYPMMKLMKCLHWKQNTVHWVIGGALGENVKKGIFSKDVMGYIKHTIVESPIMVQQLEDCGIKGVIQLPNFKPITYYPSIENRLTTLGKRTFRFVFLSRIMPEKGCDYIFDCVKKLNETGYQEKYIVDFYGKIDNNYKANFENQINEFGNTNYKGFLNLRANEGYDKLAEYDIMLFPTYWKGEGFAGVFIDTFISGVPMLASDWAHNKQFMEEGKTAIFVPVHDISALKNEMQKCIVGQYNIANMARMCQKNANIYNTDNVITKELLLSLGIIKHL